MLISGSHILNRSIGITQVLLKSVPTFRYIKCFVSGSKKRGIFFWPGERPYQCLYCGRNFTEHSSLRKHKLTHTGEKPHVCEICGKKFSQSGSRNTHQKRHAEQKNPPIKIVNQLIVQGDDEINQRGVPQINHLDASKRLCFLVLGCK